MIEAMSIAAVEVLRLGVTGKYTLTVGMDKLGEPQT
jgi:hypothetical protein